MNPWTWLDGHNVMNLATAGPEGPWSAAVYFARDDERLVFLSSARSRHASDLAADPRCAATVNGDAPDWAAIRGVQLAGRGRRLEGEETDAARAIYFGKFAAMLERADPPLLAALERIDWYELVPDRMLFIDNSRGLGHRETVI